MTQQKTAWFVQYKDNREIIVVKRIIIIFFFSFIFFSIVRILQSPVHYHLTRVYRGIKKKSVKK